MIISHRPSKCDIIKFITPYLYHNFGWNQGCDIIKVSLYKQPTLQSGWPRANSNFQETYIITSPCQALKYLPIQVEVLFLLSGDLLHLPYSIIPTQILHLLRRPKNTIKRCFVSQLISQFRKQWCSNEVFARWVLVDSVFCFVSRLVRNWMGCACCYFFCNGSPLSFV